LFKRIDDDSNNNNSNNNNDAHQSEGGLDELPASLALLDAE
jgi:hypothetical protein